MSCRHSGDTVFILLSGNHEPDGLGRSQDRPGALVRSQGPDPGGGRWLSVRAAKSIWDNQRRGETLKGPCKHVPRSHVKSLMLGLLEPQQCQFHMVPPRRADSVVAEGTPGSVGSDRVMWGLEVSGAGSLLVNTEE